MRQKSIAAYVFTEPTDEKRGVTKVQCNRMKFDTLSHTQKYTYIHPQRILFSFLFFTKDIRGGQKQANFSLSQQAPHYTCR